MPPRPRALRLDELLVERGLFEDAKSAAAWVLARKVRVGADYETRAGTRVPVDAPIEVVGLDQKFASRGGLMLEHALERFGLEVTGATVLDAGASTGGFTDCLLERGAAHVYAVDVGHGQLRGRLAADPRVTSWERTNIADLDARRFDAPIDLCVADLSYVSLLAAVPQLATLFERPARLVCLIKPLFEGVAEADRSNAAAFPAVFQRLADGWRDAGLGLADLTASPIRGSNATIEFLALVRAGSATSDVRALGERALAELSSSPPPTSAAR